MFRQGLRRCARPASSLRSVSMLARPRASITVSSNLATSRTVAPLRSLPSIIKSYSTEAEAAAEQTRTESNGQAATDFEDLRSLGVHDNILRSITRDMGYKTMTPVQAKTINPALKGTDMYVYRSSLFL